MSQKPDSQCTFTGPANWFINHHSLIEECINLLIGGEDVSAIDQWAQLSPNSHTHHHWHLIQSLWDLSGWWGTDIWERRNFQIAVIVDLGTAPSSNLSSKGSGDRNTEVSLIPILGTPSKAILGVKEAYGLGPLLTIALAQWAQRLLIRRG